MDPSTPNHTQSGVINEDDDIFQCGKCKKIFTSVELFLQHKKELCSANAKKQPAAQKNISVIPQNTVIVKKVALPTSPLQGYTPNIVFADADLLPFNMGDSHMSSQISVSDITGPSIINNGSIEQTISQLPILSAIDSGDQNTIEVPIINKLIAGSVLFMSESVNSSGIAGFVLNLANPSILATEPAANENDSENVGRISVMEPENVSETPDLVTIDKDSSTMNVITEFHSSMVKNKKASLETVTENEIMKKDCKLNCAYCSKSFTKNFDLQQHIRSHTGEKPFQCIVCGRAFAQKSNVKKHMRTHRVWPDGLSHTLPQYHKSKDNGNSIGKQLTLDKGEKNKYDDKVNENAYACPYCTYIGNTYYKLKSHMKKHEKKKVYKCILNTCGRMFADLDPFLEHVKSHDNELTYQCHECTQTFESLYDLGTHQYSHTMYPSKEVKSKERSFRCTQCLNKYSTAAALNHHLSTSSHVYTCHHCKKVFICERYLRRHLFIHSDSEPFMCELCGKSFKTKACLKVHKLTHSESKPFECHLCTAAFNRKDKLKRHLVIHEPTKKFICPFRSHNGCTKGYNRLDKLKCHILTHGTVRPHVCKVCCRNFIQVSNLREHIKTHKSDEPLSKSCKWCGEAFSDTTDTKEHLCATLKCHVLLRNHLSKKQHLAKFNRLSSARIRNRLKKKRQASLVDVTESADSEICDDIPTAHIEIISASDELVVNSKETHLSIQTDFCDESDQDKPASNNECTAQNENESVATYKHIVVQLQNCEENAIEESQSD